MCSSRLRAEYPRSPIPPVGGKVILPCKKCLTFVFRGFIDIEKLIQSAKAYGKSPYDEHLKAVAERKGRY